MRANLHYYLQRMAEAPLRATAQKAWSSVKPHLYRLQYPKNARSRRSLRPVDAQARRSTAIGFGRSIAAILKTRAVDDGDFATRARERAKRALEGRVTCLGYGSTTIPTGCDWQSDLFHGHTWPNAYFARVDYVAQGEHCDVKVPWELSRFQYLTWLAEGAIFDEAHSRLYRERFVAIVTSWLESNPTAYGVNWTCPMEVAIRATNLSLAYAIFSADIDEPSSVSILNSLEDHARFVEDFPELSDVPGNHYLADLAGHLVALAATTGFENARLRRCIHVFTAEAERQFEPDGCQLERAPIYHRLCLEMVALVLAIAMRFRHSCTSRLKDILARGIAFCRAIGTAGGKLPIFGDCDSGHVLDFGADARECAGLLQFATGQKSSRVPPNDDLAHWLFALSGTGPGDASGIAENGNGTVATADRSGFISARHGDLLVVMRVGEQGLLGRAPHDHDDALSIWLTKGERDLITEEGCHSYTLDPAIRARYINSTAHNVIQPTDEPRYSGRQGSIVKTMRGAPTASTWRHEIAGGTARLEASLGTPSVRGQLFRQCRRTVCLDSPGAISVVDEWTWHARHAGELRWHLGPGLHVETDGADVLVRDAAGQPIMNVKLECDVAFTLSLVGYEYAPVYGLSVPCTALLIAIAEHKSCAVRSSFAVLEENRFAQ